MMNRLFRTTGDGTMLANLVRGVLVLILVSPLVVTANPWPETVFPFVVGKALWTRSLIEIALGLWIILLIRNPAYRPPRYWLLGLFALYLFLALLTGVLGISPTRSLWSTYERMGGWFALAHWFVFLLILVSVLRTWEHWRALLNFNTGVGILVGLLAISEYFDWGWFRYLSLEKGRASSTMGNATFLGGYAAVNMFIAGALLVGSFVRRPSPPDEAPPTELRELQRAERRRRRDRESGAFLIRYAPVLLWRLFWLAAIALSLTALWMSDTRGAMIGLAAGLIALGVAGFWWTSSRRWRIAAGTVVLAVILLVAMVATAVVLFQAAGPDARSEEETEPDLWQRLSFGLGQRSFQSRINAYLVGINGFLDRPVLGWGQENFTAVYDRHVSAELDVRSYRIFDRAHNKVVEELVGKGVLGALAYLAMWFYLLSVFIRKGRFLAPEQRRFAGLMGGGLVCYFTQNMFLFDTPGTMPQLLTLMAFAVFVDSLPLRANQDAPDGMMFRMIRRPLSAVARFAGWENAQGLASAWRRRRLERSSQSAGARSIGLSGAAGIGVVVLLVGCAVFFLNARVVSSSHSAIPILRSNTSWAEVLSSFESSASSFPPLANELRLHLLSRMTYLCDTLKPGEPEFENNRTAFESIVEEHGVKALAVEPENHRIYLATASVNQCLASGDPDRLKLAREQINRAMELAPNRFDAQRILVVQLRLESNPEEGLRVIDRYVAEAPDAERRFAELRTWLENDIAKKNGKPDDKQ